MSMRIVPGNPAASDGAGGERRRRVAVIAGSVALAAIALGATACTATPSGSSSALSLSGSTGPATSAAAPPIAGTSAAPGAPVAVASPALVSMTPTTPGSTTRRGTPSRPATAPALLPTSGRGSSMALSTTVTRSMGWAPPAAGHLTRRTSFPASRAGSGPTPSPW